MSRLKEIKKRKRELFEGFLVAKKRKEQALELAPEQKEEWTSYYNKYLDSYKKNINLCDQLIQKEEKRKKKKKTLAIIIVLILVAVSLAIILISILRPTAVDFFEQSFVETRAGLLSVNLERGVEITEESLIQHTATIGKPVKWEKKFTTNAPSSFTSELPENSENIKVRIDGTEIPTEIRERGIFSKRVEIRVEEKATSFSVEYETPPPQLLEQELEGKKLVAITAPEGLFYEDVLSSVKIPETFKKGQETSIEVYQIRERGREIREKVRFSAHDTNENGLLDSVEFIADTGIYEIIFITKAEHLDENKNFLSDIYDQVKEKDNNWSEPIYHNEYVRVRFFKSLTSENDITVYVRNTQKQNTIMEVYNEEEKITEFPAITEEKYYKVLLTELKESSDVFDLRVRNLDGNEESYLEFDYIVDPPLIADLYVDNFLAVDQGWTEIGIPPWLDAIDANYLEAGSRDLVHGEFTFQDIPPETLRINSVTLYFSGDCGSERIRIEIWDGKKWERLDFEGGGLQSLPVPGLDTADKVNNARARIISKSIGRWAGTVQADMIYLHVDAVTNQAPQVDYVEAIPDQIPIENNVAPVTFEVHVTDPDGVTDIIDSSVDTEFERAGIIRTGTCTWIEDLNSDTANYSCSVDMQYYDEPGTWNIKVNATDSAETLAENVSTNFLYLQLTAMVLSPQTISWPVILQGDINQKPGISTILNNTGNYEGPVGIITTNLYGETSPSEFIPASTFTAGTDTGGNNPECDAPTQATALQDSVEVEILNSLLSRGEEAQEELFYCIPQVPSVSSQTYSTQQAGSWTITILAATLLVKKKRKSKKSKKRLKEENSVKALNLLSSELREEFTKEKQKIISLLIKQIKKKYRINNKQVSELVEERRSIKIPINIFSEKLEALEAISKFMKENLNLSYKEIAELLYRDERTIWTAYHRAIRKQKKGLKIKPETVSISIFNKKLTILEAIIVYLKKERKYSEIAKILNRDQRNIWTIYSRARKKEKERFKK